MTPTNPKYEAQTAAETLSLIAAGTDPWVAVGQFLDDWRRSDPSQREPLCREPLPGVPAEHLRWACLIAAAVESLCAEQELPFPPWTSRPEYRLDRPWFLYPGWRLRAWQLFTTPVPFRARNIFSGDRILERV